jgi:hypothetical protein
LLNWQLQFPQRGRTISGALLVRSPHRHGAAGLCDSDFPVFPCLPTHFLPS